MNVTLSGVEGRRPQDANIAAPIKQTADHMTGRVNVFGLERWTYGQAGGSAPPVNM